MYSPHATAAFIRLEGVLNSRLTPFFNDVMEEDLTSLGMNETKKKALIRCVSTEQELPTWRL
jgi:hypothetical protein